MKFKKYKTFISNFFWRDGQLCANVTCAYQKNRKAMFKLGDYKELCELIIKLNEMREFYNEKVVK